MGAWHDETYKVDRAETRSIRNNGPTYTICIEIEAPTGKRKNKCVRVPRKPPFGFEDSWATWVEEGLNAGTLSLDAFPEALTAEQMKEIQPE